MLAPPVPRQSWLGCWGVCVCERAPPVPRYSWLGCAVWVCVFGSGFRLCLAIPCWSVGVSVFVSGRRLYPANLALGLWCVCLGSGFCFHPATAGRRVGVCLFVCTLPLHPANPGSGVPCWCMCIGSGLSSAPPFLAGVLGCVSLCTRAACTPSFLARGLGAFVAVPVFACTLPMLAYVLRCMCVCVRTPPVPLQSSLPCAVWVCMLGFWFRLRPAIPGWDVGVCVFVCVLRLYPANPGCDLWFRGLGVALHVPPCRGLLHVVHAYTLLLGNCPCPLVFAGGVPIWRSWWPRVVCCASSASVALGAPVGFPVTVVRSVTPGALAPGVTGPARTGLVVPACGPYRGRSAGLALRRTCLRPGNAVVPGWSLRRQSLAACAVVVSHVWTRSLTHPVPVPSVFELGPRRVHQGCFVWTPTPPLSGQRTPRPDPLRVCVCLLLLTALGRSASWARFSAPHLSVGCFVLLWAPPSGLGLPFSSPFVCLLSFLSVFFLLLSLCAAAVLGLLWFPFTGVLGLGTVVSFMPGPPSLFLSLFRHLFSYWASVPLVCCSPLPSLSSFVLPFSFFFRLLPAFCLLSPFPPGHGVSSAGLPDPLLVSPCAPAAFVLSSWPSAVPLRLLPSPSWCVLRGCRRAAVRCSVFFLCCFAPARFAFVGYCCRLLSRPPPLVRSVCLALSGVATPCRPSACCFAVPSCRVLRCVSCSGVSPCLVVGCYALCAVLLSGFWCCVLSAVLQFVVPRLWSCRPTALFVLWFAVCFWSALLCAVRCPWVLCCPALLRVAPPGVVLLCAVLSCLALFGAVACCFVPLSAARCPGVLCLLALRFCRVPAHCVLCVL